MTALTETIHAGAFLASEANGTLSREVGTVASGQDLAAGTILMDNGAGKLTALTANGTAGELDGAAIGILYDAVDATDGDVANCVYIARDAEVKADLLTYPTESTDGGELDAANTSLALLGIRPR